MSLGYQAVIVDFVANCPARPYFAIFNALRNKIAWRRVSPADLESLAVLKKAKEPMSSVAEGLRAIPWFH